MSSIKSEPKSTGVGTQLRKGMLSYCVLRICALGPVYSSDILQNLQLAGLEASGGTVYPLLSRLKTDGLLSYRWRENKQGPPRKYFTITDTGRSVMAGMSAEIEAIEKVVKKVERLSGLQVPKGSALREKTKKSALNSKK